MEIKLNEEPRPFQGCNNLNNTERNSYNVIVFKDPSSLFQMYSPKMNAIGMLPMLTFEKRKEFRISSLFIHCYYCS